MIKDGENRNMTPTQVAKALTLATLEGAFFWNERYPNLDGMVTEREREAIAQAINKQYERLSKLLGERRPIT